MEETATATVEEVQLLKTLRWWDGFIIALCNPGFLLGSLGYTLGIFGVVGSMILWGASAAIGMLLVERAMIRWLSASNRALDDLIRQEFAALPSVLK